MLHRDMAVEQAFERIRRSPDSQWEALTSRERELLRTVLTDIWENCDHKRWHDYCFSTLSKADILRLIALGEEARGKHEPVCSLRSDFEEILLSCTPGGHHK